MKRELTRKQLIERAQLKAKNLAGAISQSAFANCRGELEEELQFLQCALACMEDEPVEPIWGAKKYPVSRPVPGSRLIVWDETGKFVGYGHAVNTRESGVAIQMSDGRRFDSNHDLRWQYALQPLPVVGSESVAKKVTCWSCRNEVEISTIGDCDGHCPKCDTQIHLDEEPYTSPQPAPDRDQVRREHAEWSQVTFGNVGPIGPLKHLRKEALEAIAKPQDLIEWADMQFLLWDAQRRAGITDEQITLAMIEKLAVNKQREWPEPKDGEPRLHIKEQPAPVVPKDVMPGGMVYSSALPKFESNDSDKVVGYYCFISGETRIVEIQEQAYADAKAVLNAFRAAMLHAGNCRENSNSSTNNFREIAETSTGFDNLTFDEHRKHIGLANIEIRRFQAIPDKKYVADLLTIAVNSLYESINTCGDSNSPLHRDSRRRTEAAPHLGSPSENEESRRSNSPVIPDGYVMVPKEPTPEILAVISEAIRAMRGSAATYARVLAAAPQEVKGE